MKKIFNGEDSKKYLCWGVTAFLVVAACIVFFMLFQHWKGIKEFLSAVLTILSPFVWGLAIAYILRPVLKFYERRLMLPLGDRLFKGNAHRSFTFARTTGIILSELTLVLIVFVLLRMVLPQLYSSIVGIIQNSPGYYDSLVALIERLFEDYPEIESELVSFFDGLSESLTNWITNTLLPQLTDILGTITSGVISAVKGIYYVAVGIIVSVYLLANKEAVCTGSKKLVYALMSPKAAGKLLEAVRFTDRTFMDFLSGKILDSAIIGVLCYIGCLILGMPYALLVSVIVGVTNIIPFFGPFIGAVPSAFIILLVDPMKCLIFVIFILCLQQFDGNILGPKILGGSTGVNGFWIMFAIILGGGLFGFAGMLLGVPVFVVIYTAVKRLIAWRLEKRSMPLESEPYENLDHIDPATGEWVELPPEPTAEERREKRREAREEADRKRAELAARMREKTHRRGGGKK